MGELDDPGRDEHFSPWGKKGVTCIDWAKEAERFAHALSPLLRGQLASELGLPVKCLDAIQIGYDAERNLFTIPECDASGEVIGIATRTHGGEKRFIGKGHRGLIIPRGWSDRPGPVFVPEGASDTLALHAAELSSVGRPFSNGGVSHLYGLFRDVPDWEVVIVAENDGPGLTGAEGVATKLSAMLNREVTWVLPPEQFKDVRDWLTTQRKMSWANRGKTLVNHFVRGGL